MTTRAASGFLLDEKSEAWADLAGDPVRPFDSVCRNAPAREAAGRNLGPAAAGSVSAGSGQSGAGRNFQFRLRPCRRWTVRPLRASSDRQLWDAAERGPEVAYLGGLDRWCRADCRRCSVDVRIWRDAGPRACPFGSGNRLERARLAWSVHLRRSGRGIPLSRLFPADLVEGNRLLARSWRCRRNFCRSSLFAEAG